MNTSAAATARSFRLPFGADTFTGGAQGLRSFHARGRDAVQLGPKPLAGTLTRQKPLQTDDTA
jgi:hypothetical protein